MPFSGDDPVAEKLYRVFDDRIARMERSVERALDIQQRNQDRIAEALSTLGHLAHLPERMGRLESQVLAIQAKIDEGREQDASEHHEMQARIGAIETHIKLTNARSNARQELMAWATGAASWGIEHGWKVLVVVYVVAQAGLQFMPAQPIQGLHGVLAP